MADAALDNSSDYRESFKRELELSRAMDANRGATGSTVPVGGASAPGGSAEAPPESGVRPRAQSFRDRFNAQREEAAEAERARGGGAGAVDPEYEAAKVLKKTITQYAWPLVPDFLTGAGLVALSILQFYWVASKLAIRGTVEMEWWEGIVLGIATALEVILAMALIIGLFTVVCGMLPACYVSAGWAAAKQWITGAL